LTSLRIANKILLENEIENGCLFYGCIGNDEHGKLIMDKLEEENL